MNQLGFEEPGFAQTLTDYEQLKCQTCSGIFKVLRKNSNLSTMKQYCHYSIANCCKTPKHVVYALQETFKKELEHL